MHSAYEVVFSKLRLLWEKNDAPVPITAAALSDLKTRKAEFQLVIEKLSLAQAAKDAQGIRMELPCRKKNTIIL